MKLRRTIVAAMLAASPLGVTAQTLKPGLWEVSSKMQSSSGQLEQSMSQMQQQMASLPPDQRKMMQDMMAKQGVGMGAPGSTTLKVCMTREMVERNEVPAQQSGDCKHSSSPRSGNTIRTSFTCSKPPSSGEGTVTFVGPEAYTMKMTMQTVVQGKPEKMNMEGAGRWLSADCGAVKPMAMPRK
jgi:hypothetical protein